MLLHWRVWIAAAICAVGSACGGTIAANDASVGDAGSDHVVDVSISPVDGGDAAILGYMAFENDMTTADPNAAVFIGDFYASAAQRTENCATTSFGACTLYDCGGGDAGGARPSAGTLTIFGGSLPASGVAAALNNGSYSYTSFTLTAGDVCGVSASGADVPAFAEHTVTIPKMIALTAPQPPFSIPPSQDLTVTWSNGEDGASALFSVYVYSAKGFEEVTCYFDATSGSGSVPKAALSALAQVQKSGTILWGQLRSAWFSSGAFPLELDGMQYAYDAVTLP